MGRRRRNLFVLVTSLLLSAQLTAAQSHPAPAAPVQLSARVEEYMNAAVRADHFSGSILVAKGGQAVVSKGYGMANYELNVPNTPQTVFRLASLTKAFTATAVMQLHERGQLNINDAICKHLADCPQAWQTVTVRHLLTHTSGIPNYTNFPGYERSAVLPATHEEVVARFRDKPLEFPPGEQYRYSNSGYHLLGMIVEKVSGKPYADYLRENIFAPLGMENTGLDDNKRLVPNRAAGYALDNDSLVNADFLDMAHVYAEGGLYSTTEDMLAWEQALYTEKILSRQSLDEMFTPFRNGYGYGWEVTRSFGRREINHSGLVFGFSTHIKRYPDDRATVIVLSNNQMADAGRVAADLSAIVFGAPYRIPREPKAVPTQILERYVGQYRMSPTMIVTVTLEGGKVFAQGSGQGKTRIYPSPESKFFLKNVAVEIAFEKDADGNVTAMAVFKDGRETERGLRIGHR